MIKLKYEGRITGFDSVIDLRLWTILSDLIGPDGCNYKGSSRTKDGLKQLGAIK